MATFSQTKAGLDDVAAETRATRQAVITCKDRFATAQRDLEQMVNKYADLITTINGYGTSNPAEANAKAEFAKLVTEFQSLKSKVDAAVTALAAIDFTT